MIERKYEILDEMHHVLASNMDLDVTLIFIKAYYREYYKDNFELTIRQYEVEK